MGHRMYYPQLHDPAWLQAQIDAGQTIGEIAHSIGCQRMSVRDALDRHNIAHAATRTPRRPCPHCGVIFTVGTLANHVEHCHRHPRVRAATLALLDDGDGGIVSAEEYRTRRKSCATDALTFTMLCSRCGGWAGVATEFGLLDAEGKILRDVDRERVAAIERLAAEREIDRGLAVCRVRQVGNEVYCLLR